MATHTLQKRPEQSTAKPEAKASPAEKRRIAALCRLQYHDFLSQPRTDAELEAYRAAHGFSQGWVWHAKRSAKANKAWRARRVWGSK